MKQVRTLTAHSQIGFKPSLKASVFGAALYFLTGLLPANAQWVVFDPTNYSKNIVTAIESVNATAQRSSAYVAQLQQYQTMLTNLKRLQPDQLLLATSQLNTGQLDVLKSVGDLSKLRDIQAIATEANSVAGNLSNATLSLASLKKLQQSLGGLNQAYSQRFEEARRMNLSWEQYAAKEDLQIRARVASAANRAQEDINRMDNVQKDYEFAQDMAAKIPQAEGVQQSMGIMNTQINRVVTQLAQLNKGLAFSLNSKDPAEVLAEEQKKQRSIDIKRILITNDELQRTSEQKALKKWMDDAAAASATPGAK